MQKTISVCTQTLLCFMTYDENGQRTKFKELNIKVKSYGCSDVSGPAKIIEQFQKEWKEWHIS